MSVTQRDIDAALDRAFGSVPQADWNMAWIEDPGGIRREFKDSKCFTTEGLVKIVESMIRTYHDFDTEDDHGIVWRVRPKTVKDAVSGESYIYLRLSIVPAALVRYAASVHAATDLWKAETGFNDKFKLENCTYTNTTAGATT